MKKAGDLLGAFFDERSMRTARGYSELFGAWKSLVGEKIAAHSRIAELDKAILIVEADHPGWIQILQTRQSGILENARKRFPDLSISGISFRLAKNGIVGEVAEPVKEGSPGSPSNEDVPASPEEPRSDTDLFSRIEDESFKDLLRRLEKSIKAGKRTR